MKSFVIPLETPSKKNQKQLFVRNGKPVITTSKHYKEWYEVAQFYIKKQLETINSKCFIILIFTHGDKRKRDSDNGTSSIFDLLVDKSVMEDDCWQVVRSHHVFNFYNKGKPQCEVRIYKPEEIEEYKKDLLVEINLTIQDSDSYLD